MDIAEFYTIETPPSSSTSKDSADDTLLLLQSKTRFGLSNDTMVHKFNHSNTCSIALKSSLITNSVSIKDREVIIWFLFFIYRYYFKNNGILS